MDAMNKQANELKLALVGSYPPPYGGVSTHVQRLQAQCLSNNIRCMVFATTSHARRAQRVLKLSRVMDWPLILTSRQDIIHVHNTSMHWKIAAFFFYLSKIKRAKFIMSYHSFRYGARDFSPPGRKMVRVMLKSASHCIADSAEIKAKLISMGAKPERISVIPAFLTPAKNERETDSIPREIWDFIDSHTPVISAGAFRIGISDGQDRYGIDMCIELCASLKSNYPQIGFVFCLPEIGDYDYFSKMKQRIRAKNIENNFLFVTQPLDEVYPIWQKSDIFVRPTASDGDSVSLREALYLKTPSVASDVVPRPEGTVLFKNRDVEDFIARVKMVWDNYGYYKSRMESTEVENGLNEILKVYSSLASKGKLVKADSVGEKDELAE